MANSKDKLSFDEALKQAAIINVRIGDPIPCAGGLKGLYLVDDGTVRLFYIDAVDKKRGELDSSNFASFLPQDQDCAEELGL